MCGRDQSGDRRMLAEIRAQHRGAPAGLHDLGTQAFGLGRGMPRMDRDRVSGVVQRQRDGAADAARRAGHQCDAWDLLIRHFT